MGNVKVALKGQWRDLEATLNRMGRVLSLTDVPSSNKGAKLPEGEQIYQFTATPDEVPGGQDEYEFSKLPARAYHELSEILNEAWMPLKRLEKAGVIQPNSRLMLEFAVFRIALDKHMKTMPDDSE